MRGVLIHGDFNLSLLLRAIALNAVYLGLGTAAFFHAFRVARRRGRCADRRTCWGGCSGCLEGHAPSASHRFCCCRVSPLPSPSGIPCTPKFF
jgi:hypothetical protein